MSGAPLPEDPARWEAWVRRAAAVLEVDPDAVDIPALLRLSRTVAHQVERPLVPVSSFMLGLAVGRAGGLSAPEAMQRLRDLAAEGPLLDEQTQTDEDEETP